MSLRTPLGSSGRASPFRRAESPSSSSPSAQQQSQSQNHGGQRPTTPTGNGGAANGYQSTRPATPSRLHSSTVSNGDGTWTTSSPSAAGAVNLRGSRSEAPPSPTSTRAKVGSPVTATAAMFNRSAASAGTAGAITPGGLRGGGGPAGRGGVGTTGATTGPAGGSAARNTTSKTPASPSFLTSSPAGGSVLDTDALSKLPAAQVRELREAFSILDRDGDGRVDGADVAEMLGQVGLDGSAGSVAAFFGGSSSSVQTMAGFLSPVAASLAAMGPPQELLAALAAFDDDDSGQVDVDELADALAAGPAGLTRRQVDAVLHGFTGRRAFTKYSLGPPQGLGAGGAAVAGTGAGEVFRYREWVAGLGPVATTAGNAERPQAA